MEMETLHVINGDGTAHPFQQSGLPGDVLVWREMLSEGWTPVADDFPAFWQQRGDFLARQYGLDRQKYETNVVQEVNKLLNFSQYDEITLWFEFDLFCQVNLLYLLYFFSKQNLGNVRLTLVSPDSHPDLLQFRGMGELNGAQLAALWPKRIALTPADLQIGGSVWKAYAAPSPETLKTCLADDDFGPFRFLKKALQHHLSRFPAPETGLGSVERFWLQALQADPSDDVAVMMKFWNQHPDFGFSDVQLRRTLGELKTAGLVHENGQLSLTDLGEAVVTGRENYRNFAPCPRYLGGVELLA